MTKIAFVRQRYLPPSETFIYEELKNITAYKPIVYTRKKMNVHRFPFPRIRYLAKNQRRVARSFRRQSIKLIHARFGTTGVRMMGVKKRLRVPMLTSFHGFDVPATRRKRKPYHRKLPTLFKVGEKFTVPSRQMKRKLIKWGCPPHKIKIMYSGIDLNKFQYMERDLHPTELKILAVGRLHEKKGFRYLIRAFKLVQKHNPQVRLTIVGEGDERKKLKRLIKQLKLTKCVSLKGLKKHGELPALLHDSHIFCLPSVTTAKGNQEGIPNALKEAMATGLPVISTFHGGIPELISDGTEGVLVAEKDVRGLAEKINTLLNNPELRLEMGKRGREKVERQFDSAKQVQRLERIYANLIRKGRKS